MNTSILKAPFPWFGGKRKVAGEVWSRFGDVVNYVEPFFGSGAVLLGRPQPKGLETVNDKDGFVSNFWRALQHDPEQVAHYADYPVNENDLHARHIWLVDIRDSLVASLEGHPDFYDAKVAGYWVWGVSCWIGGGFCSGKGPWNLNDEGQLVHLGDAGRGVNRQRVHLGNAGQGVKRQRVHLGDAGQGVNRQLVHLGNAGRGVNRQRDGLLNYMTALGERFREVRVCCGDWTRVCGPTVTFMHGLTGVFLDPPYADTANRHEGIYAVDCLRVAHDVREWAITNGDNPLLRIALCGYEGEHAMPDNWSVYRWNAGEGFGSQAKVRTGNGKRERIWFSPHCLSQAQSSLFDNAYSATINS